MPKRTDITSILIIGAGPIVIGQACEFDYSGTQACKVLRDEGYRIILVNSNPATIMTDPNLADSTYIEPLTAEILTKIIEKERPDAILPTVGGQTALNLAIKLAESGVLAKYNVELIGANQHSIKKAEDRQLFKEAMQNIGLECPKNVVINSLEKALESLDYIGLPAIIRPSFTLGGKGGGIAYTKEDYINIVNSALDASPTHETQIDESVIGWKEFEMEVIRDKADNCIIICSIENIDPMGVHTGDSITVAPALTLTDKEYQVMRNASIAVLREIGVDTGGSNVQFAINPDDGRMLVIEMNPRVSRSSALASKATGYPIAKIAAKLAVGYTLDEIQNDSTGCTPVSFEPTIDYIVTKIPRFTFEKFTATNKELSSSMKSVGEVMAIGRNFAESLQKALVSLETGLTGLDEVAMPVQTKETILEQLKKPVPDRLLLIAEAFRLGISFEEIYKLTKYDHWFLRQIKDLIEIENQLLINGLPKEKENLFSLKKNGFSNARLGKLCNLSLDEVNKAFKDIKPVFKRIDTCASEFEAITSYMYSCYEGMGLMKLNANHYLQTKKKVIILGSGPNRIGQGIEFDYACVHAAYSLKEMGIESIMVNCNPETVSTDYDTANRLYFEPLTIEHVMNVINKEKAQGELLGVILQFGGQTPLKLASSLENEGIPILGTSPNSIHMAEDRKLFKELLEHLNLKQPENFICHDVEELIAEIHQIGFPVVVRPSYVLGGRAMEIIDNDKMLMAYIEENKDFFKNGPILIDRYLTHAIEVDVDAICDEEDIIVAGIMEHIEEAGIHSGDSACSIPTHLLPQIIVNQIIEQTKILGRALKVKGLMNIQYAIKDDQIYILEVNPRASRTVPFAAKATGIELAKIATKVIVGVKLKDFKLEEKINKPMKYCAVKEVVFPFESFPNVDVILGPEMKSTGEVMGIDQDFIHAFIKAQIASGTFIPTKGTAFISVKDNDKEAVTPLVAELIKLGFKVVATRGTAEFLNNRDIKVDTVNKVREGSPHIIDFIKDKRIDLIINTTHGKKSVLDSFSIRRTALYNKVPCTTTITGAKPIIEAIKLLQTKSDLDVAPIQSYIN